MKIHTKIKAWERDKIVVMLSSGASIRLVAKELGRSHSSILSEIKMNSAGGKAHKKGIHSFLERKTRYYQAVILENIDSEFGSGLN